MEALLAKGGCFLLDLDGFSSESILLIFESNLCAEDILWQ